MTHVVSGARMAQLEKMSASGRGVVREGAGLRVVVEELNGNVVGNGGEVLGRLRVRDYESIEYVPPHD